MLRPHVTQCLLLLLAAFALLPPFILFRTFNFELPAFDVVADEDDVVVVVIVDIPPIAFALDEEEFVVVLFSPTTCCMCKCVKCIVVMLVYCM